MNRSGGMWHRFVAVAVFLVALFPVVAAAQGTRGMPEDIGGIPEEKEFKEDAVKLPPAPADTGLIEFRPRGSSKNRFYIDGTTLSLGADRVVRYTLLVKSPSGVANVSYEGMRCKTSEYKVYAYGAKDGKWINASEPKWQTTGVTASNFRYSLWVDYLCNSEAVNGSDVQDLIANLKGKDPYRSNTTKN